MTKHVPSDPPRRYAHVQVVGDTRSRVGESPLWDSREGTLIWVDIPVGSVRRHDPSSGVESMMAVGQPIGSVAPRHDGGLILAVRDGFALLAPHGDTIEIVSLVEADNSRTRMNDGACDSRGRFWAGTMAEDMGAGEGTLYRMEPDFMVEPVLEGVSVSNGICWNAADDSMFYIDTLTQRVDQFTFDAVSGSLSNRRCFIAIDPDDGMPDGMAIDTEGGLWVALWGGSAVRRYSADGTLDSVIELPTAQITSCAFGGPDLDDLYITSAWEGLSEMERAADPLAGALFRIKVGVRGLEPNRFGG